MALKSCLFPLPHQSTPRDPTATPLGGGTAPSLQQGSSGACWRWRAAPHPKDPRWNLPVRWRAQNSGLSWGAQVLPGTQKMAWAGGASMVLSWLHSCRPTMLGWGPLHSLSCGLKRRRVRWFAATGTAVWPAAATAAEEEEKEVVSARGSLARVSSSRAGRARGKQGRGMGAAAGISLMGPLGAKNKTRCPPFPSAPRDSG